MTKQVWEKKRPDGRIAKNGQPRIHSQRRRNGDARLVRSTHAWHNNFVSYMPSFSGYCFACNGHGHRAEECRKGSRRNNLRSHRFHAYEKNVFRSRYMHVPSPNHANIICYNCNRVGHRGFECKKRNLQSYGGQYSSYSQWRNGSIAYGSQGPRWNQRRNVPIGSRGPSVLVASHRNMTKGRWSDLYVKRFPNHEVGMNVCVLL